MREIIFLLILLSSGCFAAREDSDIRQTCFAQALQNGKLASEGFIRCDRYLRGWLDAADETTGLIPQNLGSPVWNAHNAAADNYAFMVLTASFTDRQLLDGTMLDMLRTERQLTARIDSMPDEYNLAKEGFQHEKAELNRILFGASEYIKDGLLPLTEWLGQSPWSERMIEMLDDMWKHAPVNTPYGNIVSENVEVNGEMLQTLSRVYWLTMDEKYLDRAVRLGDYYLLGEHHPTRDFRSLRLRDHGCEVVSGLCELYATVQFARPKKKAEYEKPTHQMLDRILEVGRNEHGLFYDAVNPRSGEILADRIADTWGYTYNGYYAVYMIDKTEEYRQAVIETMSNLDHYKNYNWEGGNHDGYADSIESALNLVNREPMDCVKEWIDSEMQVMWGMQRDNGIIGGWHGDGNFARTTIMYCLLKTQGIRVQPWRKDVSVGAVEKDGLLYIALLGEDDWDGELIFDTPRHKTNMNLPIDWPRINQFPEWFTVRAEEEYELEIKGQSKTVSGKRLYEGYPIKLKADQLVKMTVREK